jgi:hypothetical protein
LDAGSQRIEDRRKLAAPRDIAPGGKLLTLQIPASQ